MTPLKVNFEGNRWAAQDPCQAMDSLFPSTSAGWRINITGPGDAENLVSFPEQTSRVSERQHESLEFHWTAAILPKLLS